MTEEEREKDYDSSKITVLEGLEAVRKRPAMYIGSTGLPGLHHLVYEVVDNSVDEILAGGATTITVTIKDDMTCSVQDDGRGIPVDVMKGAKDPKLRSKSALEVVMTVLHAGGKFDSGAYKVSGGLHGVGVSCVNALSETMEVEVRRDGHVYFQRYHRGKPEDKVQVIGDTHEHGTKVTFHADKEIFGDVSFSYETIGNRLRELAFLNAGVKIIYTDERKEDNQSVTFHFEGGISQFVTYLNTNKTVINQEPIYLTKQVGDNYIAFALQYNEGYSENIFSFVNNIHTVEGGTHLSGFRSSLTRIINEYIKNNNISKHKDISVGGDDIKEGLTAVLSVKIPHPQFEGQTKTKLGNSEVEGIVRSVVGETLATFFEENPKTARAICEKCVGAAVAREAARKARDLTRRDLIAAVGTGVGEGDGGFDISKLRYHKIILMADADVDGQHISTLLLTFFYRQLKPLIEGGHIYLAQPPLYKVKKGKSEQYLQTEDQMQQWLMKEGLASVTVTDMDKNTVLSGDQLKDLLKVLRDVEDILGKLEIKNITLNDFLAFLAEGRVPLYRTPLQSGGFRYYYTEQEYRDYENQYMQEKRAELEADGVDTTTVSNDSLVPEHQSLFEFGKLLAAEKKMETFGFTFKNYPVIENEKERIHPLFKVNNGKTDALVYSLAELLHAVKEAASSGATIQRYKGLGEMNPEQLWETTMDPAKRKLIQVRINDAADTEQAFTMLMGDRVEPRRDFIQSHALEVKNLDI